MRTRSFSFSLSLSKSPPHLRYNILLILFVINRRKAARKSEHIDRRYGNDWTCRCKRSLKSPPIEMHRMIGQFYLFCTGLSKTCYYSLIMPRMRLRKATTTKSIKIEWKCKRFSSSPAWHRPTKKLFLFLLLFAFCSVLVLFVKLQAETSTMELTTSSIYRAREGERERDKKRMK